MRRKTDQQARELLKSVNLRRTRPRVSILAALLGGRRPQTADEISAKLAPPAPNRVTIYRVLESLLAAGLVHKAFLDERTWHFELAHNCTERQCHPHFTCTDCGDTHCLTDVSLPMAESPHKGFIIDRQRVQLEGLCPKCSVGTA
ncbi:MAG: Fur family transcriptional regulator [Planctomycetota bacterium]